ncbi:MAG: helix-turn-helix domain-containing protein [Granulosicoccus sp.]
MSSSDIGHRIAAAREEAGLSVLEVSQLAAVTPETVRKWEDGTRQPRANKLIMLAGILKVVPAWLLEGDDDYLVDLQRDEQIDQLKQRLEHMRRMQNRMITMLDELTCDLDDASGESG